MPFSARSIIKPTILFCLFSTRLIFSLLLRIGISTMRHVLGNFFTLYNIKALKTCIIVYKFFRLYVRRIRRISRTNRVPKIAFKINRNYPNSIVHIVRGSSMSDQHATFSLIRSSSVYQCQPLDRPTPS